MKNKLVVFTSLAITISLLTACPSNEVMESKHISQSEIHQGYFITYEDDGQILTVNAEFRAAGPNGTTIVLSEPSDIRCNGTEMKLETYLLGGAHYSYSQNNFMDSPPSKPLQIEFIDTEKNSLKNNFIIHQINMTANNDLALLQKGTKNYIELKTHPLETNESMWLTIHGDSVEATIGIKGSTVNIMPDDLKDFVPAEKVTLQITREINGTISQATARGGNFRTISRSKKWTSTIK